MLQDQQPCDPVVVVHVLDQNGKLLVIKGIEGHRHGTDVLRCPAADGCTVAFQVFVVQIQIVEKFRQVHIAGAFPAVFVQLLPVADDIVIFVPDLAHQLLQHVLHGDDAHDAAVFISNDDHVALVAAKFVHDIMELHGSGDVHRLQQQVGKLHILVVHQLPQQMLHIENADDMVDGSLINGEPGELGLGDHLQDVLHAVVQLKAHHIDPGGQDIRRVQIGKFQSGL